HGPNGPGILKVTVLTADAPGVGAGNESKVLPGWRTGLKGWRMLADDDKIFVLRDDGLHALDKTQFSADLEESARTFSNNIGGVFLKRHQQYKDSPLLMADMAACTDWVVPNNSELVSMVRAGGQIITGGESIVQSCRATDGKILWSVKVEGKVWDLAVAGGAVFASTDEGIVYRFSADGKGARPASPAIVNPFDDNTQKKYTQFARNILKRADTKKGYCVIVGLTDGRLAYEIANQSDLFILGIESDSTAAATARENLVAAGLYGKRVSIHQGSIKGNPYLDYFANVIVSERTFAQGTLPSARASDIFPMLQPCGGVMIISGDIDKRIVEKWGSSVTGWKVNARGGMAWGEARRGILPGSGEWTHMFANPANTLCSGDTYVAGTKYDIQWIGQPSTEQQWGWHDQTMTDLYKDGKIYLARKDHVAAIDAYNGTYLWGLDVPESSRAGVAHESGQACVDSDFMYVAAKNKCWLVDVNTGVKTTSYTVPDTVSDWGYLAIVGDNIVGSRQSSLATYSTTYKPPNRTVWGKINGTQVVSTDLFVLAKADGSQKWLYTPASGAHILNSSITIKDDVIYFVECRNPLLEGTGTGIVTLTDFFESDTFIVALDLTPPDEDAVKLWEKPLTSKAEEIFYLSCSANGLLAVECRNSPFDDATPDPERNYYQLRLFDITNGDEEWATSVKAGQKTYAHGVNIQPAVVMGSKAYLSMRTGGRLFTFDLASATGVCTETNNFRSSKGCGVMSGSATSLFYRNGTSEGFDTGSGQDFNVSVLSRPSCWLNDLPAGGLLLMPEASTGCDCTYALQISIVLAPQK
ncbi:MAG TPA: hypothetical protein ENL03_00875, partial [Phycisphaerae bacterium]|nr:hypothetical protein [Phycisphaerae bacterium]